MRAREGNFSEEALFYVLQTDLLPWGWQLQQQPLAGPAEFSSENRSFL